MSWTPQNGPQLDAIRAPFVDEIFFGGARGGGKTDFLLGDFAADVAEFSSAWRGILFRRNFPDLEEIEIRSREIYPSMFPGAEYRVGSRTWHFPNGSFLRFRHMENVGDADKYQGHSYSWIGFDELPTWPDLTAYHLLKACLRSAKIAIPNKRIRATGNPGGTGHQACKKYFQIEGRGKWGRAMVVDPLSNMTRMFIPSKLQDNTALTEFDPEYRNRLLAQAHGDNQLVKAWLDGDWDAFVGQYFSQWDERAFGIDGFDIPEDWTLFGALDYGEAKPSSFGLYTVDFDGKVYRICEYYQDDATASQHAFDIVKTIQNCPFTQGRMPEVIYADPSMWVQRKLSESMTRSPADFFSDQGLILQRANNDRISGWRRVKDLFYQKRFFFFKGWNDNLVRTIPALPTSHNNMEDLDTRAEDHAADELRYGIMHFYEPFAQPEESAPHIFSGEALLGGLRETHEELIA